MLRSIQQYVNSTTGVGNDPAIGTAGHSGTQLSWTVYNDSRLILPQTPYTLAKYTGILDDQVLNEGGLMGNKASSYVKLELGDVVDIVLQNTVATNGVCEQHPWHWHGLDFYVIGWGDGSYDSTTANLNTVNPVRVDSTTVYPTSHYKRRGASHTPGIWQEDCGYTVIRAVARVPGFHLFHCHIAWHMIMGMGMIFDVASELLEAPPEEYQTCGSVTPAMLIKQDSTVNEENTGAEIGTLASIPWLVSLRQFSSSSWSLSDC